MRPERHRAWTKGCVQGGCMDSSRGKYRMQNRQGRSREGFAWAQSGRVRMCPGEGSGESRGSNLFLWLALPSQRDLTLLLVHTYTRCWGAPTRESLGLDLGQVWVFQRAPPPSLTLQMLVAALLFSGIGTPKGVTLVDLVTGTRRCGTRTRVYRALRLRARSQRRTTTSWRGRTSSPCGRSTSTWRSG